MGFRINTNIAALNAQRHLSDISGKLDKSLERLSSGLRINKSSDDASGMATSVYLRGQIGGLLQAARNANDAISMTQTAEGALDVSTNILLRLRELAVQAATDTTNRTLLIPEANQLVAELTRVATDTEFVGNTLLNGSFQSGQIQIGANQGQTISFSIGDVRAAALGERATAASTTLGSGGFSVGEVIINGKLVAATQETDDQVSVLDLVGTVQVRNFAVSGFVAGSADVINTSTSIAAGGILITNGVSIASLGTIASDATVASLDQIFSNASLAGINARASGTRLVIDVTSGYDFGVLASGAAYQTGFVSKAKIGAVVGDGTFTMRMNSGSSATITGLKINDETIGAVSVAQGASIVSGLSASGAYLAAADLAALSNTDAAFIDAMMTAVNTATTNTNVTARAGSGNTLVLTADDGKNIEIGYLSGVMTVASFVNTTGLASAYYALSTDTTTYNGESSAIAKTAAIDAVKSSTNVDALVVATTVTGTAAITNATLSAGDVYINGIDIGAVSVQNGDSNGSLVAAINAKSSTTGVSASLDTSNQLVLSASDGRNIAVVVKSTAASALNISTGVTRGGVKLNSSENFTIAGSTTDLGISTGTYTTSLDYAVSLIDLSTQAGADDALASLDAAIYQVNETRSQLGAIQSRVSLTIVNLTTTAENLSASDSRIKDVDFAEETAVFTKNSILTQAATAILAQANQLPQLALQLLG
jgi:flagellin